MPPQPSLLAPPRPRSGFASSALPEAAAKAKPAAAKPAAAAAPVIDVQKHIRESITPYGGPADFLAGPTPRTLELWEEVQVGAGRGGGAKPCAGARFPPDCRPPAAACCLAS